MSDAEHDNLMREIERDEAWLVGVMSQYPEPSCRTFATIKEHVRVAVHESVMAGCGAFDAPQVPAHVLGDVKAAIRRELTGAGDEAPRPIPSGAGQSPWLIRGLWGGFAAAAVIALALLPMWGNTREQVAQGLSDGTGQIETDVTNMDVGNAVNPDAVTVSTNDLLDDYASALATVRSGEVEAEIAELGTELDDLSDALTAGNSWEYGWDDEMNDLDDELDALFDDLESVSDA